MAETIPILIKRLENRNGWYTLGLYLPQDFIEDVFIDFLKVINANKKIKKAAKKSPNKIVCMVIRKLISNYTKKQKEVLELPNEAYINQSEQED